jgi:hypothetical protein
LVYETKGHRFESCRARWSSPPLITIGPPATVVSHSLALKARHHSIKKLTVTATETNGKIHLKLHLKPH